MANPEYPPGAFFKSQVVPRVLAKHTKKGLALRALADAYAAVDARDKKRCRATGRPLTPGAVMPAMRLERHHLAKRSTHKDKVADASNIVTLAADVHQLVEAGLIEIEGTNADARLVFRWAASVKPEQKMVKLLSKRKSQNKDADAA
jgi:hypothetical protein